MHATVAITYIGLGWWAWRGASLEGPAQARFAHAELAEALGFQLPLDAPELGWLERLILLITWVAHCLLLAGTMFRPGGLQF